MSDGELEKLAGEAPTLSGLAREVLRAELSSRKLQIALKESVPVAKDEQPELVTLRKYMNVSEGLFAKSVLDSAGIVCFLADENIIRLDWFLSNALGGVKLLVRQEDAEAAEALLDQSRPETFETDAGTKYEQPRCPKCQSPDVSYQELVKRAAYASLWLGVPIPFKRAAWKCHHCGHEWEGSDEPPEKAS